MSFDMPMILNCLHILTPKKTAIDYNMTSQKYIHSVKLILPLNISKCNAMTFTRRNTSINFSYKIGNDMVTRCTQFKDLGVIVDSKLTFTAHITANAYRNLGFIMRNSRHFKYISTLSLLFSAFVRPKLEYGGII